MPEACCQQSVADFFVLETLEARHVVNKALLISLFQRRHGVNKMFFFLEARRVCNKVLLISLLQRRHGVNKMGRFFSWRHAMFAALGQNGFVFWV